MGASSYLCFWPTATGNEAKVFSLRLKREPDKDVFAEGREGQIKVNAHSHEYELWLMCQDKLAMRSKTIFDPRKEPLYVTSDQQEFVKGFTLATFQSFSIQEEGRE